MKDANAPKWLLERYGITQREWKQRKRTELSYVIKAFKNYWMGCAYCPGENGEVGIIEDTLKKLKESHSQRKWGR